MYMCWNCGKTFEYPIEVHEDPSPDGVGLPSGHYTEQYCPHCGGDDIEEVDKCPMCGEYFLSECVVCSECAYKIGLMLKAMQKVTKLSDDDFEQAIAEAFGWQ